MTSSNDIQVLHHFISRAEKNVSKETWDYIIGGSETETTLRRNRMALDKLVLRPRVLRDVSKINARRKVLGFDLRLPVILAPVGSLQDMVTEGGVSPTLAAAEFGVLHMLSSSCAPGLEAVAAAVDHPKIFQLYIRGDAGWVDEQIIRAINSDYKALCLTVDLDYYGRRERDLAKGHIPTARLAETGDVYQAEFSWRDIDLIQEKFDIPIILKGISTAEDAIAAVKHEIAAIYVSNHGGRQLDHGKGSTAILPDIIDAVGGRTEVIVDGGYMRGTDIVKAMIIGASAVGLGRMQCYALAAHGKDGVVRMLEILEDEIIRTLGMLGVNSWSELDSSYLEAAEPVGLLGTHSAFPLLDEGY